MLVSDANECRNQLRQQSSLVEFAEMALGMDNPDLLLAEACRVAGSEFDARLVQVLTLEPGGVTLRVRANAGWDGGSAGSTTVEMVAGSVEALVLESGESLANTDVEGNDRLHHATAMRPYGVRSSLTVIMRAAPDATPSGLLQVGCATPRQFAPGETAFLQCLANLAVKAVARLDGYAMAHDAAADAQARLAAEVEQRRQVEETLRQSHKMEAVGKLTGGVAHDFNNLLQGICGCLELIRVRMSQGRTGELSNYIETALASSNRAATLASQLLTFSQRRPFEPQPSKLNQVVSGMEDLFRRTVGPMIRIETRNPPDLWPTMCDPNQIESALLDLVINARDAMEDGGTIMIETSNMFMNDRLAEQHQIPPGEYVVMAVSDTGAGMTPEVRARAFEAFFTTKPRGQAAGLGLSMVTAQVLQSSGHVRLESQPGVGTTVTVYLPRYLGLVDADGANVIPLTVPRAASSVLVVDDEPAARMFVTDVLSDLGYTVMEAHDSRSGLHALESEARIDLLLTDVGLPGGMNGRQLAEAARLKRPGLKVLFVTGYEENAAIDNHLLDEGVLVMTKPFGMEALRSTVQGIIGR